MTGSFLGYTNFSVSDTTAFALKRWDDAVVVVSQIQSSAGIITSASSECVPSGFYLLYYRRPREDFRATRLAEPAYGDPENQQSPEYFTDHEKTSKPDAAAAPNDQ
jgi:hypothetical protein